MGNNSNTVENSTTVLTEIASNVNINTTQSCWTSNGATNIINFACQPSAEAILNIANGFNACIALAGAKACDRFYVALIDTQLCKFQNITQSISYQIVTNCDLKSSQAAVINTDIVNAAAQEIDTVDDIGALIFGAFSKRNTENILSLTNSVEQAFDIQTHQESFQTATISNVLDISGTGQQANSITQEAKFDSTFNAYMQSDTVSDMANTINNQSDQILTAKTSGLFTTLDAWSEAFGSIATAWIAGIFAVIIIVVLVILIVPIVLFLPKGGKKTTVETIQKTASDNPELSMAALAALGAPPAAAGLLLPPPQRPVTPTFNEVD